MVLNAGLHQNVLEHNVHLLLQVVGAGGRAGEGRSEDSGEVNGVHFVYVAVRCDSTGQPIGAKLCRTLLRVLT